MFELIVIVLIVLIFFTIFLFNRNRKDDGYNRDSSHYNKSATGYDKGVDDNHRQPTKASKPTTKKSNPLSFLKKVFIVKPKLPFDDESIEWVSNFVGVEKEKMVSILSNVSAYYNQFRMPKRSGGSRQIAAPNMELLLIQRTIYQRVLLSANIHPAATGFRQNVSIIHNAKPHLGKKNVLKVDLHNFFGSVKQPKVVAAFEKIGYPTNIARVLAYLCCLDFCLPQGAPTSPALSNIVAYDMDIQLEALAKQYNCIYTRYADDLTFSGDSISSDILLPAITTIVDKYKFRLNRKKTRYAADNKRKIITGISISSGEKLTIPKMKKRELRKNIHFILTKGLAEHQRHIGSTDPAYLQRILGYLSFWLSVEPDNQYVLNSLAALRKLKKHH